MKLTIFPFLLIALSFLFAACSAIEEEELGSGYGEPVSIPTVNLECTEDDCNNVAMDGKTLAIVFINNESIVVRYSSRVLSGDQCGGSSCAMDDAIFQAYDTTTMQATTTIRTGEYAVYAYLGADYTLALTPEVIADSMQNALVICGSSEGDEDGVIDITSSVAEINLDTCIPTNP